jgi:type I restriction enzyme S subunit
VFPKDTILITIAANIGETAITSFEVACPDSVVGIITKKDQADVFWLKMMLELKKSELNGMATQNAQKNINLQVLKPLVFFTPPLPEQQKIAQILSTWDKAIEKLEALIAAKQKRKKALMQQLLTGKKRFAEFVKSEGIQKTKFGTIPSDWQYLHIADVAKQFSVKNNIGHDLPVLSCTKHYGLVDSLSYFGKQIFSEDTSTYKVALRNSFAYATNHIEEGSIGYQNLYDKALISPMYTVFQTKENINDEFLYRLLKTELYRHIFEVNTSASVDRRGSLRWDQFSAIKIPVPSLPEQQKIASFFAVTDTEIETHQKHLSALKEQKKGLMQQLLTGKKRVKLVESA